jgi:hypothetical protein
MSRAVTSFEPESDVRDMLSSAKEDGIKLKFICNQALRPYLIEKGYSRKRPAPKKKNSK